MTESSSPVPEVVTRITERLWQRYRGTVSRETVAAIVDDSFHQLAARASVKQFLPSLTGHFAAERLAAIRRADRVSHGDRLPSVLFVCVENAGRSQMAAALLTASMGEDVIVLSAGSEPAAQVNPAVAEVLDEIGVPLMTAYPKPLTDDLVRGADFVITMGCGDACPVFPGRHYEDWEISDPAGLGVDGARVTRDEISQRVDALITRIRAGQ